MTTLVPRESYSNEELQRLYPPGLSLQLVQIFLRHGERSPVSARFQNAGLAPYWPYCTAAKNLPSLLMSKRHPMGWDDLHWRQRMETFGEGDRAVFASSLHGEIDNICELGQITDKGRETTLALGERLRRLYVDQVGFMPKIISNSDVLYLRATPLSRAIDSVQQTFVGMYPATARTASFPPPTIVKREFIDEILFPNEGNCQRFRQLCRAFAQRAADRWNNSTDLDYINSLLSKWMPSSSPRVAVDSRPRLSGIMDTINSTLAHGVQTRLPSAFYDPKAQEIIDRIVVEEWFSGYKESAEYRKLGIGALLGDAVSRMVGSAEKGSSDGRLEVQGVEGDLGKGRDSETSIKLALNGCHDTTVAAILCSLGAFEGEKWPPYTSHVALELFRDSSVPLPPETPALRKSPKQPLFGSSSKTTETSHSMARKPLSEMNQDEKERLKCYYVRVRYNDRPIVVPGCRLLGKHWEGDESFCTLEAFKAIADKITPRSWTQACVENLDKPAFPAEAEPAGLE